MILRLQNGDTIQGDKYKIAGIQAQQYQKRKERERESNIRSRSEIFPTLVKKATVPEKLQGKHNTYSFSPRGVGMSGADPIGQFIVEGVALAPLTRIIKPIRTVLKSTKGTTGKGKSRVIKGMDGQSYRIASSVSDDALDRYLTDKMIYQPESFTVPDQKLLQENILRELSWAPKEVQPLIKQKLLNSEISFNSLPKKIKRQATRAYRRANKAIEVIKNPKVKTYKNMQSMPEEELIKHNYSQIGDNVQGIHTKTGNYLNDPYSPEAPTVALHEATHGYQELLPYTIDQQQTLRNTYLLPKQLKFTDSKLIDEMGATNAEIRRMLYYKFGKPSFYQFNKQVDQLTYPDIYNIFKTFRPNAYMEDYYSGLKLKVFDKTAPSWAESFKKSIKYVPVVTGLTLNKNKR